MLYIREAWINWMFQKIWFQVWESSSNQVCPNCIKSIFRITWLKNSCQQWVSNPWRRWWSRITNSAASLNSERFPICPKWTCWNYPAMRSRFCLHSPSPSWKNSTSQQIISEMSNSFVGILLSLNSSNWISTITKSWICLQWKISSVWLTWIWLPMRSRISNGSLRSPTFPISTNSTCAETKFENGLWEPNLRYWRISTSLTTVWKPSKKLTTFPSPNSKISTSKTTKSNNYTRSTFQDWTNSTSTAIHCRWPINKLKNLLKNARSIVISWSPWREGLVLKKERSCRNWFWKKRSPSCDFPYFSNLMLILTP